MFIDCHVHLNNYHLDEKAPTEEQLRRLRDQMAKWNLDHVMVLTSYTVNPERPSASRLLELLAGDPRIHVIEGVGVTGPDPVDWDGVEKRLRGRQTWGVKIYPGYEHVYPHDRAFQPLFELAAKHRVPVMVHTGDTYAPRAKIKFAHPLHVDEVAVDYPDVQFVICHLGNPWLHDTAELMYKNQNVYADISGLTLEEFSAPLEEYMREEVADLILYSGETDKVLYGTDWPLVRMGPYLRFVESLKMEPDQRRMLLGENAAELFRIPRDAPVSAPPTAGPDARPAVPGS